VGSLHRVDSLLDPDLDLGLELGLGGFRFFSLGWIDGLGL